MKVGERDDVRLERPVKEIWQQALEILSKQRQITHPTFVSWIQPLQLVELSGNQGVIASVNDFGRSKVANGPLHTDIENAISQVVGDRVTISFTVDPSLEVPYTGSIASISVTPERSFNVADPLMSQSVETAAVAAASNLHPRYTMDTFVVGSHNRLCHSAAVAVSQKPGQAYNPLFIYGGVGLGKTHIMHAIGHYVMTHFPGKTVRYMTCEKFTNDLINAIQNNKMVDFRRRYRQVDVLLMDDIQFIEGKERTQEEFFHTFNALRDSGRQIVLSSDRPPKAISTLEERLRSRFEWGMIADIQAPDLETRMAILRKKCEQDNLLIPDDVVQYIATVYTNNIRELEGALLRLNAYANLTGASLNLPLAESVLDSGNPKKEKKTITVEAIIEAVASHYRLEGSDLRSAKRSQDLALPRHIAMYLAQDLLSLSTPRIGESFGNRKHTSVLHAIKKVKESMAESPELSVTIKQIARKLND